MGRHPETWTLMACWVKSVTIVGYQKAKGEKGDSGAQPASHRETTVAPKPKVEQRVEAPVTLTPTSAWLPLCPSQCSQVACQKAPVQSQTHFSS